MRLANPCPECISMIHSATNLGFPRIGSHRELKKALEVIGPAPAAPKRCSRPPLPCAPATGSLQQKAGIDHIPSNDFSLYDQMLDTIAMLGAVPERFGHKGGAVAAGALFRHGAGPPGCAGDGNDQMVRHQLPLHRARTDRRHGFALSAATRRWTNSTKPNSWASPPGRC